MKRADDTPLLRFAAVRKWRDGGEQLVEWFATKSDTLKWIEEQPKSSDDEFIWCIGEM